jgi:hypothetical protein
VALFCSVGTRFGGHGMGWRFVFGFVAGLLSVVLVHQTAVYFGGRFGFGGGGAWSLARTGPWGVPALASAAVFGGLWGVLLTAILPHVGRGVIGAISAVLIMAVLMSLFGWFVVAPVQGRGIGFVASRAIYPLVFNAVWAIGALVFLRFMPRSGG